VAHVSDKNNSPTLAMAALAATSDMADRAQVADQDTGFSWLEIN